MSSFLKAEQGLLVESALTAAISTGVDKFMYKEPVNIKKAGVSAASAFVSGTVTDAIAPSLLKMAPSMASMESTALKPLVSGIIYSVGSGALGVDNRSFLFKTLLQGGSQIGASYASVPLKTMMAPKTLTMRKLE